MLDLVGTVKSLIKISSFFNTHVQIDNVVFRIHYKLTISLLVAFSVIINSRQYFGDPIVCSGRNEISARVLDAFCWIHSFVPDPACK